MRQNASEYRHNRSTKIIAAILASLASVTLAVNAPNHSYVEMHTTKMQSTAKLLPGRGLLHHSIATTSSEAQQFFDQGLTLVYGFNFEEAARSFHQAAEFDPRSPMPYWGIALANGPSYNSGVFNGPARTRAAYAAIQTAIQLSADAPENERRYVNALSRRFTNDQTADPWKLARDYAAAMHDLTRLYPKDPDAATLYAETLMDLNPYHLWTFDGKPGEDTLEIVSTLEGVLGRWPDHLGANHFYIHAMEASPYPQRALASARQLETLAPAAGHLVHMPAHIYFRIGDYAAAVKSCLAAADADKNYTRETSIPNKSYELAYAEHNLYFLVASANMDGEFAIAQRAAIDLQTSAQATLLERPDAESLLATPFFVLMRFARWDDILALPAPGESLRGLTIFWHFARGCAFVAKGAVRQAHVERALLEEAYDGLNEGQRFGMLGSWTPLHELAIQALDARIATAHGDLTTAIRNWRTAVSEQDKLEHDGFYRELPIWYYPVRESLGALLLRNGYAAEAEKIFREDLSRNPHNPRSLFGLREALMIQNKADDARQINLQFESAWKGGGSRPRLGEF